MNIAEQWEAWQAANPVANWKSFMPALIERLPDGKVGVFDSEVRLIATMQSNWALKKIAEIIGAEYTPAQLDCADYIALKKHNNQAYGLELGKLLNLL